MFVKGKVYKIGKRNKNVALTLFCRSPVAAEIQSASEKSSEEHCCSLAVAAAAVGWMTARTEASSLVGQESVRAEGIKMKYSKLQK